MRRRLLAVCALLLGSCMSPSRSGISIAPHPMTGHQAIMNGTRDTGDPAVVELYYITSGGGGTCTGELIGPHTVMTAGHCTDLSRGGELSGTGGPALVPCKTNADAEAVANNQQPSSNCNLATFVIFNNQCTATQAANGTCESNLISSGDFIIADQLVNPGYDANASTGNDNDIGLLHLIDDKLYNGGSEPGLLIFNRSDEGAQCTDLGQLRFVGFGVTTTDPNTQTSGVKYMVNHDAKVHDTWHNEEDGSGASQWGANCGNGSGSEPTCSGDSGGPSFNSAGQIVAVTSLGDNNCSAYGQDTRVDAHASWIDTTMQGWGDPINGTSGGTTSSGGTTTGSSTTSSGGTSGSSGGECQPCDANGNCSNGGTCVDVSGGVCTAGTCSSDADCASGDGCFPITDQNNNPVGNYCFPSSGTCPSGGTSSSTTSGGTSSSTTTTSGGTSSTTSTTSGGTTTSGNTSSTTTSSGGTTGDATTSSGGSTGASAAGMCLPCISSCSNGGQCLTDANGGHFCTGETCHTDADCGSGNSCYPLADANNEPLGSYCFPTNQTCPVTGGNNTTTSSGGTTGGTGASGTSAGKTSAGGGSTGGCTSAAAGDVLFALMALLPLVRRKRR